MTIILNEPIDMSPRLLSPLERILVPTEQPISVPVRSYHPSYSPAFPASHLLSLLPLSSKLCLRRLSTIAKNYIDAAHPSVFSNLRIPFPLSATDLQTLRAASPLCEHLTVIIPLPAPSHRPTDTTPLPPFPRLTHLHLIAPDHDRDPFPPLLSFRLALQRAVVPHLTHLTLTNLSFPGLLALRWGSLTAFGDAGWTGRNVWLGLRELDVEIRGWWEEEESLDGVLEVDVDVYDGEDEAREEDDDGGYGRQARRARRRKEDWRTCTRVLHDWLHAFAAGGRLNTLRFNWLGGEGPDPLMLDEVVGGDGKRGWFSAPGVKWEGLREVWLGGVVVAAGDVRRLKGRVGGLERLGVLVGCLGGELGGRRVVGQGVVWAVLDVGGERWGEWKGGMGDGEGGRMKGSWGGDRRSMVVPVVLDGEVGEGEGEG